MNLIILDGEKIYIYDEKILDKYKKTDKSEDIILDLGFNINNCNWSWSDTKSTYLNNKLVIE